MFGVVLQVGRARPATEIDREVFGSHRLEASPFLRWQRHHHPAVRTADLVGQEIIRNVLHRFFTMNTPQRAFDRRQHVVAANRDAERK